ncbi:MAG: DUF3553 domain-containing protein [Phycisphaerales bacterium]|nr:DUF3553 domain-containing protein [Phycisphaerales bacterium]
MPARTWTIGERVVHSGRPEWGWGVIVTAEPVIHEGAPCQRLGVRFDRAGIKTLSTAFADLRPASEASAIPKEPEPQADALAAALNAEPVDEVMTRLPEAATDPFISLTGRLKATLNLYKYSDTGASLLEWATAQTGLRDPLSRFNRHELEQWFSRFKMEVDTHLRKLLKDARRTEPGILADLTAQAGPAAKQALRRADAGR